MHKNEFQAFVYKVIIPVAVILLVFYLFKNVDLNTIQSTQKLKTQRNKATNTSQVNWMTGWEGEKAKKALIEEFARNYEFSNQQVKINIIDKGNPSVTKQAQEIVRMVRNNIFEMDIFRINDKIYSEVAKMLGDSLWGKQYLVDFGTVEGYKISQKSEVINNPYILNCTEGLLLGPYIDGEFGVLWFNSKTASKLGLEIKDREMDFQDLIDYAQHIQNYNLGIRGEENRVSMFCESNVLKLSILFQHLVWTARDKLNVKEGQLFSDSLNILQNILKNFETLSKYDVLNESNNVLTFDESKKYFLNDNSLFMLGTTNLFNELKAIDSLGVYKILPAELPYIDPPSGYFGTIQANYAVFSSSPNRNNAIAVLKALSTESFAEKWVKNVKNPTGLAVNLYENYLENDPYNNFLNYIAKKYNYNIWYSIGATYLTGEQFTLSNSLDFIDENLRAILLNEISAGEAYNNLKINITR